MNLNITKKDILNEVHDLVPNISKADTKQVLETFYDVLREHLVDADDITLYKIGKFSTAYMKLEKMYNFHTGRVEENNKVMGSIRFVPSPATKSEHHKRLRNTDD